jgi:hypothetical protein
MKNFIQTIPIKSGFIAVLQTNPIPTMDAGVPGFDY